PVRVGAALRSGLSLELEGDRVLAVADEQPRAGRSVNHERRGRLDLAVLVDQRVAEVLEDSAARSDLVGDEHGREVPAIAPEDAEIGRPPDRGRVESHLPAAVDGRRGEELERPARRGSGVVAGDGHGMHTVGPEDPLRGRRIENARQEGDRAAGVHGTRLSPERRERAPARRRISVLYERNGGSSLAPEGLDVVHVEYDP